MFHEANRKVIIKLHCRSEKKSNLSVYNDIQLYQNSTMQRMQFTVQSHVVVEHTDCRREKNYVLINYKSIARRLIKK